MAPPISQFRNRPEWKVVKTYEDEATGLVVEVSRLPLTRPRYNVAVGAKKQDGSFSRFLVPKVVVENAVVTVSHSGLVLARLLDQATLFVQEALQKLEDDEILRRQIREQRQIERETGKADVAHTGKTEREAAKRLRHDGNLAARRSADQERTHLTKGKGN